MKMALLYRLLLQAHRPLISCHCKSVFLISTRTNFFNANRLIKRSVLNNIGGVCVTFSFKQAIHVSAPRRAIPPVILALLRPIAHLAAAIFGRTVRWWWTSLPQHRKDHVLRLLRKYRLFILACIVPATAGLSYFYVTHLEVNPLNNRTMFIAFSPDQMKELAEVTQQSIVGEYQDFILKPSHPVYNRIVDVATRLIKANLDVPGISGQDWRVIVVDQPLVLNSFVLPNGTIFVFTGILSACSNDDQLGIILSHEIAHIVLHHMAEQMTSAHLIELLLFIPILTMWTLIPPIGAVVAHWLSDKFAEILIHLPFSRKREIEADKMGLVMAAKACMDVREASAFWTKMNVLYGNGSQMDMEWLSTHPKHETRQQLLDGIMTSAIDLRDNCKCPRLPVHDPRTSVHVAKNTPNSEQVSDDSKTLFARKQ